MSTTGNHFEVEIFQNNLIKGNSYKKEVINSKRDNKRKKIFLLR